MSRPLLGATARATSTGEKRANDTHESKTDPDAKLFRKGSSQPAKLYFMGHALIENRHGLVVQADATQATGKAEREAALAMIDRHDPGSERQLTLAADKGTIPPTSAPGSGKSASRRTSQRR